MAFLQAHVGEVAFITIDIGGNDILGLYGCLDLQTFLLDGACVDANLATVQADIATIVQTLHAAVLGIPRK